MSDKINSKIQQALEGKNIRPKEYYTAKNIFKIVLVAVCGVLILAATSYFIWDILWKFELIEQRASFWELFRRRPIFLILGLPSWEFIVISALLYIVIRVVYRTTDWPFVRNTTGLMIAIVSICIFISMGFVVSGRETPPVRDRFERVREEVQRDSPLFERRKRQLDRIAPDREQRPFRPRR